MLRRDRTYQNVTALQKLLTNSRCVFENYPTKPSSSTKFPLLLLTSPLSVCPAPHSSHTRSSIRPPSGLRCRPATFAHRTSEPKAQEG
ncbi:unnamed protein product [Victoria cruziana]